MIWFGRREDAPAGSLDKGLEWMAAAELQAQGSCEEAAASYDAVIRFAANGASAIDAEDVAFCVAQAAEAYAAVADWSGLETFLNQLKVQK